jgi:hypothetical protein
MNAVARDMMTATGTANRYARCVELSQRNEWQIDRDLLRGREFDFARKFLPDGLSLADRMDFLSNDEKRVLSQVQGRTYAYVFGLVERFISVKMLTQAQGHSLGDQQAMEALVRFSAEELKHQQLFRRIESMLAAHMPPGYTQAAQPNDVARAVLAASTWSVLALTCHIELFVQAHYAESIAPQTDICPVFRDVFRYHWMDECRHVVIDELEWRAENDRLSEAGRERAVDDLIGLVGAVDGILQAQSGADVDYFVAATGRSFTEAEMQRLRSGMLAAYRWQYIISGVRHPHFGRLLAAMTTPAQMKRIQAALAPIMADA